MSKLKEAKKYLKSDSTPYMIPKRNQIVFSFLDIPYSNVGMMMSVSFKYKEPILRDKLNQNINDILTI